LSIFFSFGRVNLKQIDTTVGRNVLLRDILKRTLFLIYSFSDHKDTCFEAVEVSHGRNELNEKSGKIVSKCEATDLLLKLQ